MVVLHDAAGQECRVTIAEENGKRFLYLDGCEEGAMDLASEQPVFNYLWFHKLSKLTTSPRRVLVLGAGAFTAVKCLALDYPDADVDAVDVVPELGTLARQYFRLDGPQFARVHFHGTPAENFLTSRGPAYDLVFDDLFDGFQHVPATGRGEHHVAQVRRRLGERGVYVKNMIWDPRVADTRAACMETIAAVRTSFVGVGVIALGDADGGHNRLLIGLVAGAFDWRSISEQLARAGVPRDILEQTRPVH
jgi:spermidine synthase